MKRRYRTLAPVAVVAVAAVALVSGTVLLRPAPADPIGRVIPVGVYPTGIAVDSRTGRAFVMNEAGASISVIDTATGALLNTVAVGVGPRALAVDASHGRVFVMSNDEQTQIDGRYVSYWSAQRPGQVQALDASTGQQIWTTAVGMLPDDMAVDTQDGHIFVHDLSPDLRSLFNSAFIRPGVDAIDATSGRPMRRLRGGLGASWGANTGSWTARHVVVSVKGFVLDSATARSLTLFSPLSSALDSGENRIALVDRTESNVRLLDARDGSIVADTVSIGFHPVALAVDRRARRVLVVDGGIPGHVGVFATKSGRLLRVATAGSDPRAIAVDERSGRAFVANRMSRTVSVLDTRTGRLVRAVRVRWDPIAVAVDERTGHAFVLSAKGEFIPTPDRWSWLPGAIRSRLPFLPRPASPAPSPHGSVTIIDAAY